MKFVNLIQYISHIKERKIMKQIIGLCAVLSYTVFTPLSWGMETFEELAPCTLYQDLIPDTGESFKVVVDHVNQGDSQHRDLVKKWVYNLFVSPELLNSIKFDALIDLRDIRGMNDLDMYACIRLLDKQSWQQGEWVPSFVERLKNRAITGNTAAQNNLGLYYDDGLGLGKDKFGIKVDFQKSNDWLTKAAIKNNPYAQRNIALHYKHGRGCRQDSYQAKQWLKMSADQGHPLSQTELSELIDNQTEALRLLNQAAQKRFYKAEYNLGLRYLKGDGVDQNKDTAVVYFKKSAEQNHYESNFTLASIYFTHGGFFEAFDELNILLNKESINNQNYSVHYYLGFLYEEGLGSAKRDGEKTCQFYDTADGLLKKAILAAQEGGNLDEFDSWLPHLEIAYLYESGLYGIPRDLEKVRYWYTEAANFGHEYAHKKLSELSEKQSQDSGLRRRNVSKIEEIKTDKLLDFTEDDYEERCREDRKERGQLEQEHCVIS